MRIFDNTTDINLCNTAVTLGKFDGLHKGHQRLLDKLLEKKNKSGYNTVLFSFDITSKHRDSELTTKDERIMLCKENNVDNVIFYPVNETTMRMMPEDFIENVLIKNLGAKVIITGTDFRFGHERRGDVELLKKYGNIFGYEMIVEESLMYDGKKVSSTDIKKSIAKGNLEKASKLLGYDYFVSGEIISGRQIGRNKLETKTINILSEISKVLPPQGVYATKTVIEGKQYKSITNVGTCPTVTEESKVVIETHLFDFDEEVYGKDAIVYFIEYIRGEKKFESVEKLKSQIEKDKQKVISMNYL